MNLITIDQEKCIKCKIALQDNSPMIKLFNIPKGKQITGAVMVGYTKYNYPKLVDRNPLKVTFYQT